LAEYYVNPNVSYTAPLANAAPKVNSAPVSYAAPVATPMPSYMSPAYAAHSMPMTSAPCGGYVHGLSAEAILVLFILLVIITRLCG
jgi:hypothetical protein